MDGEGKFVWKLVLEPLSFELSVPTETGPHLVYFPMSSMEARGLLLAIAGASLDVFSLLRPDVQAWIVKCREAEKTADEDILKTLGVQA